jgi:hypothetical protein
MARGGQRQPNNEIRGGGGMMMAMADQERKMYNERASKQVVPHSSMSNSDLEYFE